MNGFYEEIFVEPNDATNKREVKTNREIRNSSYFSMNNDNQEN